MFCTFLFSLFPFLSRISALLFVMCYIIPTPVLVCCLSFDNCPDPVPEHPFFIAIYFGFYFPFSLFCFHGHLAPTAAKCRLCLFIFLTIDFPLSFPLPMPLRTRAKS